MVLPSKFTSLGEGWPEPYRPPCHRYIDVKRNSMLSLLKSLNDKYGIREGSVTIDIGNLPGKFNGQDYHFPEGMANRIVPPLTFKERLVPDGFPMDNYTILQAMSHNDHNPYAGIEQILDTQSDIIVELFELIAEHGALTVFNYSGTGSGKTLHMLVLACLMRNHREFTYHDSEDFDNIIRINGRGNSDVLIIAPAAALIQWKYGAQVLDLFIRLFNKMRSELPEFKYKGVYIPEAHPPMEIYVATTSALSSDNGNVRYAIGLFNKENRIRLLEDTVIEKLDVHMPSGEAKNKIILPYGTKYKSLGDAEQAYITYSKIVYDNRDAIEHDVRLALGEDSSQYAYVAIGYSVHEPGSLLHVANKGLTIITDELHKGKNYATTTSGSISGINSTVTLTAGGNISIPLPEHYHMEIRGRSVTIIDTIPMFPVWEEQDSKSCALMASATISDRDASVIATLIGAIGPQIRAYKTNGGLKVYGQARSLYLAMVNLLGVDIDFSSRTVRFNPIVSDTLTSPEEFDQFAKNIVAISNPDAFGVNDAVELRNVCAAIMYTYIKIAGRATEYDGTNPLHPERKIERVVSILPIAAEDYYAEEEIEEYAAQYHKDTGVARGSQALEEKMVGPIIEEALVHLLAKNNNRVLIALRHTANILNVATYFHDIIKGNVEGMYIPNLVEVLVVTGGVSQEGKSAVASLFGTNPKFRLMIIQVDAGSESISYHSRNELVGDVYILTVHNDTRLVVEQLIGRCFRCGSNSNTYGYVFIPASKYRIVTRDGEDLSSAILSYYDQEDIDMLLTRYGGDNSKALDSVMDVWVPEMLLAQVHASGIETEFDGVIPVKGVYSQVSPIGTADDDPIAQGMYDWMLANKIQGHGPKDDAAYADMVALMLDSVIYTIGIKNISLNEMIGVSTERGTNLQRAMPSRNVVNLDMQCAGYGFLSRST